MAIYHLSAKMLSRSTRNTVGAVAYRAGCKLVDQQTGESFDFRDKAVHHVELLLPEGAPQWAQDLQELITEDRQEGVQKFVDLVEAAEKRKDAQVYRELEFALMQEFTDAQNIALAKEFLEDQCCRLGIVVLVNFHLETDEETGEYKPHCHALLLTRRLEEQGLSAYKERGWNSKEQLMVWREQWAAYANFHLKMHGFIERIDHRSNRDRGIELEGQPKRGKGVKENERRQQQKNALEKDQGGKEARDKESSIEDKGGSFHGQQEQGKPSGKDTEGAQDRNSPFNPVPILDKVRVFQEVKLKNLYRIIQRPDLVLEIAAKNHATFMWGDVQKILARYIDDAALYQKLEAKLKSSPELVLLRMIDPEARKEHKETAVYTTKSMLKAELNLVRLGESLSKVQSHPVKKEHIERVIGAYNQELAIHGGLSADQKAAICHLTKGDQLSCVVGYAGAGKTTALRASKEIWQAEGYQIYGLAPTGKVARNLEQLGIKSQTLHKFLQEFESGRCRYSSKSILMLDEAGMVDTERFDLFLNAVKNLGVKAVVVGENIQLQPVEAGAPLRLVTERAGLAKLETVVRQKEEWQREATKLFGQLKTREAIEAYYRKGCIEFVDEKTPDLTALQMANDHRSVVELYNLSRRVAGNIYHSMLEDLKSKNGDDGNSRSSLSSHQDYGFYQEWKTIRGNCISHIHAHLDDCKLHMKELGVEPLTFALWFVDRSLPKQQQIQEAHKLVAKWGLPQLDLHQDRHVCDVKAVTRQRVMEAFLTSLKDYPQATHLIFAYTNKDTRKMNEEVRFFFKQEGKIEKEDHLFTIHREDEDDFKDKIIFKEERHFAVGDRILFTRNENSLGVNNGTLGTVTSLNRNKIQVQIDGREKTVSFAPRLYPFFDQGWAATINKTQGSEAGKCFLLASREMYRNLSYVGMTRHRDSLKVFGSRLDFWRDETFIDKLSSMNEKLMGIDYISSDQAYALMKEDDRLLTRVLNRVGDQLNAIKYVSKRSWQEVCVQFLGEKRESSIVFPTEESLSEAERAKLLWAEKERPQGSSMDKDIPEELVDLADFNTAHAMKSNSQKASAQLGVESSNYSSSSPQADKNASETLTTTETLATMGAENAVQSQNRSLPTDGNADLVNKAVGLVNSEKLSKSKLAKTDHQEKPVALKAKKHGKLESLETRVMQAQTGSDLKGIFKDYLIRLQARKLDRQESALIDKLAQNTTEQVINFKSHHGKEPRQEDLKIFMRRAFYEEKRIARIAKSTIKDWKEDASKSHTPATERLKIRAYAERIALIEGKLYEQAMRGGKKPPHSKELNQLACQEFIRNQKRQAEEASAYQAQLNMSAYAASRMANEVLRHQERYGVKLSASQFEAIKKGVQYQEQRLPTLHSALKDDFAERVNGKPSKQDIGRINAIAEYLTHRESEAFKYNTLETGTPPSGQRLRQLQNEVHADYQQNMKPEVNKLIKQEDKMRQNSKNELSP